MARTEKTTEEDSAPEIAKAQKVTRKVKVLADGVFITSKRGVLKPGDEVKPEYLGGGEAALNTFIKANKVITKEVEA